MGGYRSARAEQEARAEAWTGGHSTELDTFYRRRDTPTMDGTEHPVTFKDWLIAHRGSTGLHQD